MTKICQRVKHILNTSQHAAKKMNSCPVPNTIRAFTKRTQFLQNKTDISTCVYYPKWKKDCPMIWPSNIPAILITIFCAFTEIYLNKKSSWKGNKRIAQIYCQSISKFGFFCENAEQQSREKYPEVKRRMARRMVKTNNQFLLGSFGPNNFISSSVSVLGVSLAAVDVQKLQKSVSSSFNEHLCFPSNKT